MDLGDLRQELYDNVLKVDPDEEPAAWRLFTLAISTFGWTPKSLSENPGLEYLQTMGQYLVDKGITSRTWRDRTI